MDNPIPITAAQYQAKFGVPPPTAPVVQRVQVQSQPIPITAVEYKAKFGSLPQQPSAFDTYMKAGDTISKSAENVVGAILKPAINFTNEGFAGIKGNSMSGEINQDNAVISNNDLSYLKEIQATRQAAMQRGDQSTVNRYNDVLKNFKFTSGKTMEDLFPNINDSSEQVLGNALGTVLALTSGGALSTGGSIAAEAATGGIGAALKSGAITGLAYGTTGGLSNALSENKSAGGVLRDTITGGVSGLALGTAIGAGVHGLMQTPEAVSSFAGKTGDALDAAAGKLGATQTSAVSQLESDYEKWTGATKPGVKSLNAAESRTAALDNSGTSGRLPQRVLAESGVIPETTGTKFTTAAQADKYIKDMQPLSEAADNAVDEISSYTQATPIATLEQQNASRIKGLGLTVGDEKSLLADSKSEFQGLRDRYGDSMTLSEQKTEKSLYQKPVRFDSTKPFKSDFNYQMGKTFQTSIEKTAADAGFADVAQLNREIGDRYAAATMLRKLDGQTLKYGKIGKYAMGVIGAGLGKTIPGKILGYMGGEFVADMLMKADVSNPIKRLILKSIEEKSPAAYEATMRWLEEQDVLRASRLALPEPGELGTSRNPIITPAPTTYEPSAKKVNGVERKNNVSQMRSS